MTEETKTEPALLPCPNPECGRAAADFSWDSWADQGEMWRVACRKCLAAAPYAKARAEAARLWNLLPREAFEPAHGVPAYAQGVTEEAVESAAAALCAQNNKATSYERLADPHREYWRKRARAILTAALCPLPPAKEEAPAPVEPEPEEEGLAERFKYVFPEGHRPAKFGKHAGVHRINVKAVVEREDLPVEARDVIAALLFHLESNRMREQWLLEEKDADLATAIEERDALREDAERYRWLRSRDPDTIGRGGVFVGRTPQNVILTEEDLDRAVDAARQHKEGS